jgi:hypothetical protein
VLDYDDNPGIELSLRAIDVGQTWPFSGNHIPNREFGWFRVVSACGVSKQEPRCVRPGEIKGHLPARGGCPSLIGNRRRNYAAGRMF